MKNGAQSLLEQAIDRLRHDLTTPATLDEKLRAYWAVCVGVEGLGAWDVVEEELVNLARDTGLIRALGPTGESDIRHIIACARRGEAPFA